MTHRDLYDALAYANAVFARSMNVHASLLPCKKCDASYEEESVLTTDTLEITYYKCSGCGNMVEYVKRLTN